MSRMQAAYRIHRFGGPEVLQEEWIDVPDPASGEGLIRAMAVSLNPVDVKTREGTYPLVRADRLPYVLVGTARGCWRKPGSACRASSRATPYTPSSARGRVPTAQHAAVPWKASPASRYRWISPRRRRCRWRA